MLRETRIETAVITQSMLQRYRTLGADMRLVRKEMELLREALMSLDTAGASIEPGELSMLVIAREQLTFSRQKIIDAVGESRFTWLAKQIPKTKYLALKIHQRE